MKRLIPASILLVLVIAAYISGLLYITDTCKNAEIYIEKCEKAYSSGADAEKCAKALSEYWDEKEKTLSFFVNHDRIDGIELEISSLSLYNERKKRNTVLRAYRNP